MPTALRQEPATDENRVVAERLAAKAKYYDEAYKLARMVSEKGIVEDGKRQFVICSGGGPSIMEAANKGASDAGAESIGLNIVLPHEQAPNPYVTPYLSFQFHYFALRKMHFLLRAKAVAVFPGGFGTFDEFFELLTLIQTGKMKPMPILLFGKEFWTRVIDWEAIAEEGVIAQAGPRTVPLVRNRRGSVGSHRRVLRAGRSSRCAPPGGRAGRGPRRTPAPPRSRGATNWRAEPHRVFERLAVAEQRGDRAR